MMVAFITHSVALVGAIANHPEVRPTFQPQGEERLDVASVVLNPLNVCVASAGGTALFIYQAPGRYLGHILLLQHARGRLGLVFGQVALAALSHAVGRVLVCAAVPTALPAARWYVRRLGFVSKGVSPDGLEEHFELET